MHKKIFGVMYVLNIIAQSAFSLITSAALGLFAAWLLVRYVGAPKWTYAVLLTLGVISGFISMIKFAISASEGLERLEKQKNYKDRT